VGEAQRLTRAQQFAKGRNIFDRLNRFEDYDDFFLLPYSENPASSGLRRPVIIDHWDSDEYFGEQRLSGVNPLALQRLDAHDLRAAPLCDVESLGFEWRAEAEAGRLYICDYTGTDPTYRGPAFVQVRTCSRARSCTCSVLTHASLACMCAYTMGAADEQVTLAKWEVLSWSYQCAGEKPAWQKRQQLKDAAA
jgi:hypothetical protein